MSEEKKPAQQEEKHAETVIELSDLAEELSEEEMKALMGGKTINFKGKTIQITDYSKSRAALGRLG
jgi:natural product precursor